MRHLGELLPTEHTGAVVRFVPEVWRIEIKQHLWPIISFNEAPPRKLLDDDTCHPFVDRLQLRSELQEIEASTLHRDAKILACNLAAESRSLEIEEPCGPLQIGQGRRVDTRKALEFTVNRTGFAGGSNF